MTSDLRIEISDRYAQNPEVVGNPTAYDLYIDQMWIGTCVVFDQEEPILGTSFEYYEKRGLATINSLFIRKPFRRRGYGSALLRWVIQHLYNHRNIRYVELDDTTDYFGREDCIYRKVGFHYDRDDNHMMINLRHWFAS